MQDYLEILEIVIAHSFFSWPVIFYLTFICWMPGFVRQRRKIGEFFEKILFLLISRVSCTILPSFFVLLKENNRAAKSRPCINFHISTPHIRIEKNNFLYYSFLTSIFQIEKISKIETLFKYLTLDDNSINRKYHHILGNWRKPCTLERTWLEHWTR